MTDPEVGSKESPLGSESDGVRWLRRYTYHLPAHVSDVEDGGGRPPAVYADKTTLFMADCRLTDCTHIPAAAQAVQEVALVLRSLHLPTTTSVSGRLKRQLKLHIHRATMNSMTLLVVHITNHFTDIRNQTVVSLPAME